MKTFPNAGVKSYKGEPLKFKESPDGELTELSLKRLLWLFLNAVPIRTNNDAIQGVRLAQALDNCPDGDGAVMIGAVVIEEGVYDWMKDKLETVLPPLLRLNAPAAIELLKNGFER